MNKAERQYAIKELIGSTPVASQDELRRLLKRQGIAVTQATLSRDMKELGIIWVSSTEGGRYALQLAEERRPAFRQALDAQIMSIVANESLVVVHTLPGSASVVAEYIDALRSPQVIGTVAGDNTVLVVPRSQSVTCEVLNVLKDTLIKGKES